MPLNRLASVLLLGAVASFAQGLTFGFVGGVPITTLLGADTSPAYPATPSWELTANVTDRYIVGPSIGWRFHNGFSLEAEALYRNTNYENLVSAGGYGFYALSAGEQDVSAGDWEFPLQVKYRLRTGSLQSVFPGADVRPYFSMGGAFDTIRVSNTYWMTYGCPSCTPPVCVFDCGPTGAPIPEGYELVATNADWAIGFQHKNVLGAVAGAGLDFRAGQVHILPEIRYTRWAQEHFDANFESSPRNQFEFLVTISR